MNQSNNKVVGVALDTYKVSKFQNTITKKGFEISQISPLNKAVTLIRVSFPAPRS